MRTPPAPSGVAPDDASPPRRARRWRRVLAVSLVALLAVRGALTAAFQFGLPWWMGDRDSNHTFTNEHGTVHYQVHLPPERAGDQPLPVMMALHGCGMTGFRWNSMKSSTAVRRARRPRGVHRRVPDPADRPERRQLLERRRPPRTAPRRRRPGPPRGDRPPGRRAVRRRPVAGARLRGVVRRGNRRHPGRHLPRCVRDRPPRSPGPSTP